MLTKKMSERDAANQVQKFQEALVNVRNEYAIDLEIKEGYNRPGRYWIGELFGIDDSIWGGDVLTKSIEGKGNHMRVIFLVDTNSGEYVKLFERSDLKETDALNYYLFDSKRVGLFQIDGVLIEVRFDKDLEVVEKNQILYNKEILEFISWNSKLKFLICKKDSVPELTLIFFNGDGKFDDFSLSGFIGKERVAGFYEFKEEGFYFKSIILQTGNFRTKSRKNTLLVFEKDSSSDLVLIGRFDYKDFLVGGIKFSLIKNREGVVASMETFIDKDTSLPFEYFEISTANPKVVKTQKPEEKDED